MKYLVIGGDGRVGSALVRELQYRGLDYAFTSRTTRRGGSHYLDLSQWPLTNVPIADTIYLVAAIPSFVAAEDDPRGTWRVNVDAPLAIARGQSEAKIVFVSSDAVSFCGHTEYGRQKAHVEAALYFRPRTSIVRSRRLAEGDEIALARILVDIGVSPTYGFYEFT